MTSEGKLKACPFCGGKAEIFHSKKSGADFYVECYDEYNDYDCCEARTPIYDTNEQAVEAWNTRASPWIPVETPPSPEFLEDDYYILPVFELSHYVESALYNSKTKRWTTTDDDGYDFDCTHIVKYYMPRPRPPEEGES